MLLHGVPCSSSTRACGSGRRAVQTSFHGVLALPQRAGARRRPPAAWPRRGLCGGGGRGGRGGGACGRRPARAPGRALLRVAGVAGLRVVFERVRWRGGAHCRQGCGGAVLPNRGGWFSAEARAAGPLQPRGNPRLLRRARSRRSQGTHTHTHPPHTHSRSRVRALAHQHLRQHSTCTLFYTCSGALLAQ